MAFEMFKQMGRTWLRPVLACAVVAWSATAGAQDELAADKGAEGVSGPTPTIRTVGFQDRSDESDCDQIERQYGWCVEEVDFVDLSNAWTAGDPPDRMERAQQRTMAKLYAQLWEDLAVRWNDKEDILGQVFSDNQVADLNSAAEQWGATYRHPDKRVTSLPDEDLWLTRSDWLGERDTEESVSTNGPFYRYLRIHHPSGVFDAPRAVMLKGRWATRLAYDGKRHNFDLMDADPDSSGPFFEQMYPYTIGLEVEGGRLAPLSNFIVPEQLKNEDIRPEDVEALRRDVYREVTLSLDADYGEAKELATDEFHSFYHLVGTQIVRFALEEYTPTHLRVLTALIAMRSPPTKLEGGLTARDVVAASEGQTDDSALIEAMAHVGAYAVDRTFELNYAQLPKELVDDYVKRFPEWYDPSPEFLGELNEELHYVLQDYLRRGSPGVTRLDDASLKQWVDTWSLPGRAPDVTRHLKRVALSLLVSRMENTVRDELETRMLLDHVDLAVSSRFNTREGDLTTPAALEDTAGGQWRAVLGLHGYAPEPIPEGPGAVDPLAICTTKDRREALDEESFGALNLDVLVLATDGLSDPAKVLWEARYDVPFLMVDNPKVSQPRVTRLVGLPGERAIYRVRWKLWSGWHFLWNTENLGRDDERERLVLRTGAVCENTVLAPPKIVATLARAALLDGEFIPPTAARHVGGRKKKKKIADNWRQWSGGKPPEGGPDTDEVVGDAAGAGYSGYQTSLEAQAAQDRIDDDMTTTDDQVLIRGANVADLFTGKEKEEKLDVEIDSEAVAYVRDLMRRPLRDLAASERVLLVVAFDTEFSKRRPGMWAHRPRAPYALKRKRAAPKVHARTASWVHAIYGPADDSQSALLSPAYRPTESVTSGSPTPRWRRRRNTDFTLAGGLSAFPVRHTDFSCPTSASDLSEANDFGTVVRCEAGDEFYTETDGIALDISSLVTWWVLDQPRLALDFGPELRFEMVPAGKARVSNLESQPRYSWSFSPMLGFIGGVRFAPDPHRLWVRSARRTPWGADGPDGTSRLGRSQVGLRGGFLVGPGYNGLEGNVALELWGAKSVRRRLSKHASRTPYHPRTLVGPFVRGQYGFVLLPDEEIRYSEMQRRYEVLFGVRGQLRLTLGRPAIPGT